MSDLIRTISISSLCFLSFFCFQVGIFLWSGHQLKQNGRRTLIFIELFTGFMLLFDALAYIFRGNASTLGWYMVRLSNLFVYICNFSISFFFCFYVCEFIKQSRLSLWLIFHPKSSVKNGIPVQLFIVFFLCLAGICLIVISQFTNENSCNRNYKSSDGRSFSVQRKFRNRCKRQRHDENLLFVKHN